MFSNYGRGVEAGEGEGGGARRPEQFFERCVLQPGEQGGEAEEQVGGGRGQGGGVGRGFFEGGDG